MDLLQRTVSTAVPVVALALLWLVLAPPDLGGSLTLVTVQGSSMEPTLVTGDLAVLQRAQDYAVGEVVAFRSDMAGAVVLHRIVAQEPDTQRFVLVGDNNDFLDRYRPAREEIVGRMVLTIPAGVASALTSSVPWLLGIGAALTVLLLHGLLYPARGRRRGALRGGRRS
ncbi:MAG: signal peptidase I [Nitriliruptoraceae bacterium]